MVDTHGLINRSNTHVCIDASYVALTEGKRYVLHHFFAGKGYASDNSAFVTNDEGITYKYVRRRFKPYVFDDSVLKDFK